MGIVKCVILSGVWRLRKEVIFHCFPYVLQILRYGCAMLLSDKQTREAVGEQPPPLPFTLTKLCESEWTASKRPRLDFEG